MVKVLRKGEPIKIFMLVCWADSEGYHGYDFFPDPTVYGYYKLHTPGCSGRWGRLELVENFHDADLYMCFKRARKEPVWLKHCPPQTVINFCREPKLQPKPSQIGEETLATWTVRTHYNPQDWWVWNTYDDLNKSPFPKKTKLVSFITTGRYRSYGQKTRLDFTEAFTKAYPNVLDLYGRQAGKYNLNSFNEYKGYIKDKWTGLAPYKYTFVFEKAVQEHYFSEKLIDAILAGCMPIYQGCQRMNEYFPEGSYYKIDSRKKGIVDEVWEVINSDYREQNIDALMKAKDLILNEYQSFPFFEKAITELIAKGMIT